MEAAWKQHGSSMVAAGLQQDCSMVAAWYTQNGIKTYILKNRKFQVPDSKSQISNPCFQGLLNHDSLLFPPWDLDLGIWDVEFLKYMVLSRFDYNNIESTLKNRILANQTWNLKSKLGEIRSRTRDYTFKNSFCL